MEKQRVGSNFSVGVKLRMQVWEQPEQLAKQATALLRRWGVKGIQIKVEQDDNRLSFLATHKGLKVPLVMFNKDGYVCLFINPRITEGRGEKEKIFTEEVFPILLAMCTLGHLLDYRSIWSDFGLEMWSYASCVADDEGISLNVMASYNDKATLDGVIDIVLSDLDKASAKVTIGRVVLSKEGERDEVLRMVVGFLKSWTWFDRRIL